MALGMSYPALILTAIVATANHFVLDAVAGAVVCGIAWHANGILLNLLPLEDYFLSALRMHKPISWTDPEVSINVGGWKPGSVVEQDATTYVGNTPNDPYASQYSDYFTKYTFAELWRNHDVHGQYADGSTSPDGNTYGAWLVHNTRETYYGGPLHSDLVVDGIVYNYMVSGHHGAPVPNITHGFDRTFGPQFYYFNQGGPKTSLQDLRQDAAQYADPEWNAEFYDSIAKHVPNYAPTSQRTTFTANIKLPRGAKRVIAVLSENKQDFQLNVFDTK
ncbi:hypothetical protein BN1723_017020, partial [Verticillium longisporum]